MRKLAQRINSLRTEYGRVGFWAVYSLVMPAIGLMLLSAAIYQTGPWFKSHPAGIPVFTVLVVLFCGFAILTTNVISIVAGWAFGLWWGVFVIVLGIAGAITIHYYFGRRIAAEKLAVLLEKKPKMMAVKRELLAGHLAKVFLLILLLRFSLTPFAATNYLISAAGVSFWTYFAATVLGYIPRTIGWVIVGLSLEKLDLKHPLSNVSLLINIGATIAVIVVLSVLSKRALKKLSEEAEG
ncbi:MAG: VTT domain-containing protein [Pyrinomonadaceae bacterium]